MINRKHVVDVKSPSGRMLGIEKEISGSVHAPLSKKSRLAVVEEAIVLLQEYYVHRRLKEARFAINPVQELRVLKSQLNDISYKEFHQRVITVFTKLRDRHLSISVPSEFGIAAKLPFMVEKCSEGGRDCYIVSQVDDEFSHEHFKLGVEVVYWNGTPIADAVATNATKYQGGNRASYLAQGLRFLTTRPLSRHLAPSEKWVDLTYLSGEVSRTTRFTWAGFSPTRSRRRNSWPGLMLGEGLDQSLADVLKVQAAQFAPSHVDIQLQRALAQEKSIRSGALNQFSFKVISNLNGEFGYIRIWNFSADDVDQMLNDFVAILDNMPRDGLIIDIRANPGGYISAGERILQTLTPRPISPAPFQFIVSDSVHEMVERNDFLHNWLPSLAEGVSTGALYSRGFPVEGTVDDLNKVGQKYYGPVVLITDALSYSTADIFAAGFQDHAIGTILGTDINTGAGGANNWRIDILRLFSPGFNLSRSHRESLDNRKISVELRNSMTEEGVFLTSKATVQKLKPQYGGDLWAIQDRKNRYLIRDISWMNSVLNVYFDGDGAVGSSLPKRVSMGVSIRRCLRVNGLAGRPLEDLGVTPDLHHKMTRRDILDGNYDLIAKATEILKSKRKCWLGVEGREHELIIEIENIDRIDIYLGNRPIFTKDVVDGVHRITFEENVDKCTVSGYIKDELVAEYRL